MITQIARDVVTQGHLVGNHSFSHPRLIFKPPQYIESQIYTTDSLLAAIGSTHRSFFRPPYTNKFIILPYVLAKNNFILVTGTYDPKSQYRTPFPTNQVVAEVVSNTRPGSIIYLHDGRDDDAQAFVTAIDQIITILKADGYKFVTVDYESAK